MGICSFSGILVIGTLHPSFQIELKEVPGLHQFDMLGLISLHPAIHFNFCMEPLNPVRYILWANTVPPSWITYLHPAIPKAPWLSLTCVFWLSKSTRLVVLPWVSLSPSVKRFDLLLFGSMASLSFKLGDSFSTSFSLWLCCNPQRCINCRWRVSWPECAHCKAAQLWGQTRSCTDRSRVSAFGWKGLGDAATRLMSMSGWTQYFRINMSM